MKEFIIFMIICILTLGGLIGLATVMSNYSIDKYNTNTDKLFNCSNPKTYMDFCDNFYRDKVKCVYLYEYEELKRCSN